ncbi:MAG: hypothetical protein H0X29_09760 [Parachlamydiaceae bacterium]|nr:hypothetical protein [Parachlamydiaceae bacterium]
MKISKEHFFLKAISLGINKDQVEALWSSLEKNEIDTKVSSLSTWLYYFGAFVVVSAMLWLMELSWTFFGGEAKFLTSLIYGILFALIGLKFWKNEDLKIPAGIFIALAICMVPLAIYGLDAYFNVATEKISTDNYQNFFRVSVFTEIAMEVGTIMAGLAAFRFIPFPFIMAPIFLAAWFFVMDLGQMFFGKTSSLEQNEWLSLCFGFVMVTVAYVIDLKKTWSTENAQFTDYAFWPYFFGIIAFWVSLTTISIDKGEVFQFVYLLINLLMMLSSIILDRRIFMVYGALGTFIYLNHLAYSIFKDSILFPLALIFIGIAIVCLGILYQKNNKWIKEKILKSVPDWLKKYLPTEKE